MKRRLLSIISLLLLFIASPTAAKAQESPPRFEPADCPINVPASPEITCGDLVVPEDYDNPQGPTVSLPVVIIHNRNGHLNQEALLYTEGGPAYSSLSAVWWQAYTPFADDRDIVILEQRGNLYAKPSLDCEVSIWWEETAEDTTCLDRLLEQGIDLSHYTTDDIAADIDALRQALGYDTWNLMGSSYSTRLMQLVINKQPDDIRSVVLLSAVPMTEVRYRHDPEHPTRSIQVMLDDCAANPNCAAAYRDLENQLFALIADLNANPLSFEFTYPGTAVKFDYEVNGYTLLGWMIGEAFYQPAYPPFKTAYLPLLISEAAGGNIDLLYAWAKEGFIGSLERKIAWGLFFSVNCQDFAPNFSTNEIDDQVAAYPQLDGYFRHRRELDICAAWGLPPSDLLLDEPVTSDIPTLILGGSYDPITPPEWSRTAVVILTNSIFVEVASAGHNVLNGTICPDEIINAFLNDPYGDLDLSCINQIQGPQFILPGELIIAPAVYEIHHGELGYSMLEENFFMGSLIGMIGSAVLIILAVLVTQRQEDKHTSKAARLTQPFAVTLAAVSVGWSMWLRVVLRSVAKTVPIVLRFGMPAVTWPIFALAMLIGLMTIALLVLVILSWKRRCWSLIQRILVSLTTLAALVFCGMLGYWGILTALFTLL